MKILVSFLAVTVLLTGCASMELDREFGLASQASFDQMVTYPDYLYVNQTPEGMDGIHAEGIMKVYDDSYRVRPRTENIIRMGLQ